jgi:hypothetical protein
MFKLFLCCSAFLGCTSAFAGVSNTKYIPSGNWVASEEVEVLSAGIGGPVYPTSEPSWLRELKGWPWRYIDISKLAGSTCAIAMIDAVSEAYMATSGPDSFCVAAEYIMKRKYWYEPPLGYPMPNPVPIKMVERCNLSIGFATGSVVGSSMLTNPYVNGDTTLSPSGIWSFASDTISQMVMGSGTWLDTGLVHIATSANSAGSWSNTRAVGMFMNP